MDPVRRYRYRLTVEFRENGEPDKTPAVEEYDSYDEAMRVMKVALDIMPLFDPVATIERIAIRV